MSDLGKKIDTYFKAKQAVHDLFGYAADWVEIPMEDRRGNHWMLVDGTEDGGRVAWADEPFTEELIEKGERLYGGPIYTQRFLKKWVYRAEEYVMISVDTQTDGNKFLMIFDADKECVDENLRCAHRERW